MTSPSFLRRLVGKLTGRDATYRTIMMSLALVSERGEASGAALARDTLAAYVGLTEQDRSSYFDALVRDFSPDKSDIAKAAEAYLNDPSQLHLVALQDAVESPRQELFRRLNMAPGGTSALVQMRQRLLDRMRIQPEWSGIEADLGHLLASWFNRGFLVLQRIDWRTPALVLEKLIAYEAVHEIHGWEDLRRRLSEDRRCFAFFHPALPDEPIIFIEVALTRGMSDRVEPLLDAGVPVSDPHDADTAIFYSITNCQEGLRGISFGNLLIKQVVEELRQELPRLKTFSTLSPIPGFQRWLQSVLPELGALPGNVPFLHAAQQVDRPDWHKNKTLAARIEPHLLSLCAYYLLHAKSALQPLDPVSRFHLGNGARLARLNWLADRSNQGMKQSAGMMVNYEYRLDEVERNHETYANENRVVSATRIETLARECVLHPRHAKTKGK